MQITISLEDIEKYKKECTNWAKTRSAEAAKIILELRSRPVATSFSDGASVIADSLKEWDVKNPFPKIFKDL